MLSRKFVEAVKLSPKRAYRIAQEAGVHPTTLSKILNGIELAHPNDTRVIAVAKVLGLRTADCFELTEGQTDE
jgi:hypothetical protein